MRVTSGISVLLLCSGLLQGCNSSIASTDTKLEASVKKLKQNVRTMHFPGDADKVPLILAECQKMDKKWEQDFCYNDVGSYYVQAALSSEKEPVTVRALKTMFDAGCLKVFTNPSGWNCYLGRAITTKQTVEVIAYLIEQGNDPRRVSSRSSSGNALHVAILANNREAALYFISSYPQFLKEKDPLQSKTPLELAEEQSMKEVADAIRKALKESPSR